MQMTEREKLIWLAGILEGEGCFRVDIRPSARGVGRCGQLRVILGMTDLDVIERANSIFPSSANMYVQPKTGQKTAYVLHWNGPRAKELMEAVLPFMCERRSVKIQESLDEFARLDVVQCVICGSDFKRNKRQMTCNSGGCKKEQLRLQKKKDNAKQYAKRQTLQTP